MNPLPGDAPPENPGIIFMGTPEFAVPALEALIGDGYDIRAVVTQPDRPRGRGRKTAPSPVKQTAAAHDIPILQPEKISDEGFLQRIRDSAPDLMIVIAFGQILKKGLLSVPEWGAINIHASLLPRYRGAAPIQRAVLHDDSLTGLTVMRMDEGLDTGPILYQEEIPILKDETSGHLHDRLAVVAGDVILRFMKLFRKNRFKEQPQDNRIASYAPKIDKSMCAIDWKKDARDISALIRALDPLPGAYTNMGGRKIKLFASSVVEEDFFGGVPGRVLIGPGESLRVETGKGVVEVREMQHAGKRRMASGDFLRGFAIPEGTILGK